MNFRWGIIGLGSIARKFAEGLSVVPDAKLHAVGSRSQEKADKFGDDFGAVKRYGSYQSLIEDADVDAIYIATPHPFHYADASAALKAGRAVLCEKPFTINAAEAAELIQLSRSKNVFLMEAMWTRFTPVMVKIRELLSEGAIGDIRLVEANFGYRANFDPRSRLFSPELGGGALLDVGIYPLSFASMILGAPTAAVGLAQLGETGVDEQSAFVLKYLHGELAVLSSAVRTTTSHVARVYGSSGNIVVEAPWWISKKLTLNCDGDEPQIIIPEFDGNGYNYEAIEVQRCIRSGKIESEILPLSETLTIMRTMDQLRASWGLIYPMENS